jgi:hypothetical protein
MLCASSGLTSYTNDLVKLVLLSLTSEKSCALPPIQWSVILDPLLQTYPGL